MIRSSAAITLSIALTVPLAACGSDKKNEAAAQASPAATASPAASASASAAPDLPTVKADPNLEAKVPAALAKSGEIVVGTDATYAPSEFLGADGKTVEGFDIDLFNAVAAELGLKTKYVPAPFDSIIPGVQSGKFDVGVSSFSITPARLKTADMVSYFSAGIQWATRPGNPAGVNLDDACGKHVAVQKGTTELDDLTARSTACTQGGKPAIAIDQYQGQDQATAAVVTGKDDAMSADSPVVAYAITQSAGKVAPLGDVYAAATYGYVLKKGNAALAQVLADAVGELIGSEAYRQILDHWGVGNGAIPTSAVDPNPQ